MDRSSRSSGSQSRCGRKNAWEKLDQDEIAVLRMRDQVQAMGQDKRQGSSWVRPDGAADVLHGIAAQVDLDLEVVVSVWGDNGRACLLVANIEVRAVAALLHAIGAHAGGTRHRHCP